MFKVTIEEIPPPAQPPGGESGEPIKRYEQVVDTIDMRAVMAAVNTPPRVKRVRKAKKAPA